MKGAAVVTGAGSGIGRAIALRLGRDGYPVAVNDIDARSATATAGAIVAGGGQALAVVGDVSSEADVRRMLEESRAAFGDTAVLVNNAGVDVSGSPSETTRERWSRVHDVDLWGPMLMTREAERDLSAHARRTGFSSVVNIASNHALATMAGRAAYAAAKAGMVGLTRGLAIDLGPAGIRVNVVLPGYIETPIWDLWLRKAPDPQGLLARIAARHPARRLGTPDDVAGVVSFLAGPDAGFITGSEIVVDGGNTALLESPLE